MNPKALARVQIDHTRNRFESLFKTFILVHVQKHFNSNLVTSLWKVFLAKLSNTFVFTFPPPPKHVFPLQGFFAPSQKLEKINFFCMPSKLIFV